MHVASHIVDFILVLSKRDVHVVFERIIHELRSLLLLVELESIEADSQFVLLKGNGKPHRSHLLRSQKLLVFNVVVPCLPHFTLSKQPMLDGDDCFTAPCLEQAGHEYLARKVAL